MPSESATEVRAAGDREKRWVALSSLLAAIGLTGTKLVVGLLTNSLGILSEAAHSGLDLVAAAMTLWAVRVSARPADRQHTYGHGKFENLSALVETLLLLLTCVWIIYESVHRLWFVEKVELVVNAWAFLVVILSIVVDFSRSRAPAAGGQEVRQPGPGGRRPALLHRHLVVRGGAVGAVRRCWPAGRSGCRGWSRPTPWPPWAWRLSSSGSASNWASSRSTISWTACPGTFKSKLPPSAASVPGVESVKQVRLRRSGPDMFADVTLAVNHAAAVRADARHRRPRPRPRSAPCCRGPTCVVHIEPVAGPHEDLLTKIRVLAARHGLGAHGIRIYEEETGMPSGGIAPGGERIALAGGGPPPGDGV